MYTPSYRPEAYGPKEVELIRKFMLQHGDARRYFLQYIKPRLDRSYKLYIAYTGDRQKEIKRWQTNIFVPYVNAVVETLMPRILDAQPDFTVLGRTQQDQLKAPKVQQLATYNWELAKADETMEELVRSCLIYGLGFLQVYWKKDVRTQKFLKTQDIAAGKYEWEEREQVFFDAPTMEWVDNYSLMYDPHNIKRESKQFWFKRLILTGAEIKRRYPMHDPLRLAMALNAGSGDLANYASVRNEVKSNHERIVKGVDNRSVTYMSAVAGSVDTSQNLYMDVSDIDLKMHEVLEWWRPFDDEYAVMVNNVPILKGGSMPNPYDFKEVTFIDIPYLRPPNEFEGYGIPLLLETPQIILNLIKNQRLDAVTLSIHKMWIVNPLANINKSELVTRPFGIIYSNDPNGVREVQFGDIKSSAYQEEELLKGDMRYASGVDDFSMGAGGSASSATEVRHLRESTLERVRLFVNHLGSGLSVVLRYWIDMYRQFYTKEMTIRITGDDGTDQFPLIEKDDLEGRFDFQATVLPSIAGQNDVNKKQGMDLFQLLIPLPFVDPQKLTSKVLHYFGWNLESISAASPANPQAPAAPAPSAGAPGVVMNGPVSVNDLLAMGAGAGAPPQPTSGASQAPGINPNLSSAIMKMLGTPSQPPGTTADAASLFAGAASPINLLNSGMPPTAASAPQGGAGGKGGNPRGHNRTGKVNTNLSAPNYTPEGQIMNRTLNIQR